MPDTELSHPGTELEAENGISSRMPRFWVGAALHFRRPAKKTPQILPLSPQEFPKLQQPDLVHLDARIGLDAPQQIRAAPGPQVVSAGGIP